MTTQVAMRQVLLYPSDGMWVAEVPSLPGTISQGATREEAMSNIREAIDLMLEVLSEHGDRHAPRDYPPGRANGRRVL